MDSQKVHRMGSVCTTCRSYRSCKNHFFFHIPRGNLPSRASRKFTACAVSGVEGKGTPLGMDPLVLSPSWRKLRGMAEGRHPSRGRANGSQNFPGCAEVVQKGPTTWVSPLPQMSVPFLLQASPRPYPVAVRRMETHQAVAPNTKFL